MLDALAGYLARETPRLYRVHGKYWRNASQANSDSYTRWLQDMVAESLHVNEDLLNANSATIVQTAMQAAGLDPAMATYIRCDMTDKFSVRQLLLKKVSAIFKMEFMYLHFFAIFVSIFI